MDKETHDKYTKQNKTGNPVTEHKVDILDRLNPNMVIGRGVGQQLLIKNMKYK